MVGAGRPTCTSRSARRRDPRARAHRAPRGLRAARRRGHAAALLPDPLERAAEAPRDQAPARLRVLDSRRRALPRQRLLPARGGRRRVPSDSRARSRRSRSSACPPSLHTLAEKPRGLVLVTGPTGSGKSTTLAAMIDEINRTRPEHILTIEDPIEFVHRHKSCIVNQREIGPDAASFGEALRAALRQDPDVILVGEMRDLETIVDRADRRRDRPPRLRHAAHAERPVDDRPHHRRLPGRAAGAGADPDRQLAPGRRDPGAAADRGRPGRVAALEILFPDDAVRNLIRQGKVEQIYSVMQTGTAAGHADDGAGARRARRSGTSSRSRSRARARAAPTS